MRIPWLRRVRPAAEAPEPGSYAALLAAYAAINEQANAADKERRRLRKLIDEVPAGVWGRWRKSLGEPARIVDMERVRELLMERGLDVPMKDGAARLRVDAVGPSS